MNNICGVKVNFISSFLLFISTYLIDSLTFGHKLVPNLHSGVAKCFQHISRVQAHEVGDFICH